MDKEKKLGQEPAFANGNHNMNLSNGVPNGMLKRFYAACAAMQGILSSPNVDIQLLTDNQKAEYSFIMADELLEQETN